MSRPGRRPPEGPSQRQLRAGEVVRHALVEILARGELRDPDLVGLSITVGEVRASPDLKHMTAFVAPLLGQKGAGGDPARIAAALSRSAGFLRGRLGRMVDMKHIPHLHFTPDFSYAEAGHIAAVLNRPEVRRDLDGEGGAE